MFIPAVGQLSRPSFPSIKGRETFAGPSFHSAEWDHRVDLTGKKVAVIGTGASAIQFVPAIQPQVEQLTLFQRSAPYIIPRPDTEFSGFHHRVFELLPLTQRTERAGWWAATEVVAAAFLHSKVLSRALTAVSRAHMKRQTGDAGLFAKVWPDYPIGCKRVLFSSTYLPALAQANADIVTDAITEITPEGVITPDGTLHEADVIIYGTGFAATDILARIQITGLDGRDLHEQWREGARAYLGISVPNFPNLFVMYGPNTGLGSGSIVFMLEAQARYICQAVKHAETTGPIAVRDHVEAAYDEEIQGKLAGGVWTQCSSWYQGANGRVVANWPYLSTQYTTRVATFDAASYESVRRSGHAGRLLQRAIDYE